jgi:hypothetical protein
MSFDLAYLLTAGKVYGSLFGAEDMDAAGK